MILKLDQGSVDFNELIFGEIRAKKHIHFRIMQLNHKRTDGFLVVGYDDRVFTLLEECFELGLLALYCHFVDRYQQKVPLNQIVCCK